MTAAASTTVAPRRRVSGAALALASAGWLLATFAAAAEVVDIAWKEGGRFEHTLAVGPGKFAELCGALASGQIVSWSFEADTALNFNIHYHVGKDVRYPARTDQIARSQGELAVEAAQDYCWMWTNKSALATKLAVRLVLK